MADITITLKPDEIRAYLRRCAREKLSVDQTKSQNLNGEVEMVQDGDGQIIRVDVKFPENPYELGREEG